MSLAVTTSTTLLYAGGSGWADLQRRRPASADTPYLWFSLTKIATATAAMALADRGRLDLDAPVSDYLPSYPTSRRGARPVVRQLLDHTAGLPNPLPVRWIRPAAADAPDPATFLARLLAKHGTVKHPIGGQARYSNLGYLVLAEVIAAAVGEPFVDVLQRRRARPRPAWPTPASPTVPRRRPPPATSVCPAPSGSPSRRTFPPAPSGSEAADSVAFEPFVVDGPGYGGLIGDVIDAARLARLHLADGTIDGHRVLAPDTARRMRTISSPGKPVDLGLGWYRKHNTTAGPPHVEHLGAGGGYYNAMRIYPDLDLGLVVMANTTARYDHDALFDRVITIARLR